MLTLGVVLNPVAGLGGAAGLKGSDDPALYPAALARGGEARGPQRLKAVVQALAQPQRFRWLAAPGALGGQTLLDCGLSPRIIALPDLEGTGEDTSRATRELVAAGSDLLLFVGGDGTARDVLDAEPAIPVLGIPAGVKMHSGVFATSPHAAALLLDAVATRGLVALHDAEVRDVDEAAARRGVARSRFYGELKTPQPGGFLQHTKVGGRENEGLATQEIVAAIEAFADGHEGCLVLGPGGTLLEIKQALGGQGTLLGVDVRMPDRSWQHDVSATDLLVLERVHLVLSFARGQGVLLGRGNQQLSADFIRGLDWHHDVTVVATRSKVTSLEGRALLVDTGERTLDETLAGLKTVLAGPDDWLLYEVSPA